MAGTATAVEAGTTSAIEPVACRGRPEGVAAALAAEIFERHRATVLGHCRMLLRDQHEAEDAAQQTFLAAYRALRNGAEPRYPAAWLATIARNECWAAIEHRMRQPVHQGEPESGLPDPVVQAAANADLEELWRAIGELPRQQRQALLLREFSGLTYAELAGALGVTEPAVESLLVRARRALRGRLRPLSGSAAAVAAPLVTLRDALARLLLGMPDAPSASGLAKLAAAPTLAKLAAGAVAVVVAGGTVTAVDTSEVGREVGTPPAEAAVVPLTRPVVHRAAVARSADTTRRATVRSTRSVRSGPRKRAAAPASVSAAIPALTVPRRSLPPSVAAPVRGAEQATPLPSAAPAPEPPVAEAPTAPPRDDQRAAGGSDDGPRVSSSGPDPSSGEDASGAGDGGAATSADSSGPGPGVGGDDGSDSGSASSGPGGDGEAVSGEGSSGPGGGESGESGGGEATSGSGGGDPRDGDHSGGSHGRG